MPSLRRGRLALAAMLLLALSGCSLVDTLTGVDRSTPTGERVEAQYERYFEQVLEWRPCGEGAQCATAIAPLDWDSPSADTDIELALSRHKATGGSPQGSLFFNPGGPGASGADYVRDAPAQVVSADVRADFDLIGWDPRGVGSSSSVTCYTDPQDFDEFLFGIPDAERGTPEFEAETEAAAIDFAQACAENSGPVLQFVDTVSTVRDLDLLRALVGDERLNYLGYSYGTEIGARYADRFPDKVGRLVLDGVSDPSQSLFDVVLSQTKGFDRALRAYLGSCTSADCPFTGRPDADIASIAELYARLDAQPLPNADGRLLDAAVLDTAIASALYDEQYWPILSTAFSEVLEGEASTAFMLADAYYGRENGRYLDRFYESFIAISCLDYPVERDPAVLAEQNAQLRAITPLVVGLSDRPDPLCGNWRFPPRPDVRPMSAPDAAPILVVGTAGDPATPYESAVSVAEQLESAVLVSYNGTDHIAYDEGDPCVNSVVDAYLLGGAVPDGDPRCGF
ncbi:alpha/beta hydrolase family protein [Diaminobutyricimonas aerilata]|uniref:Alpha/beta hydrolase family protein n=1 Tax=Diaminobutyricimonas aerilata TaxID=1162967 RepID=A0A2M9CGT3_9MICO|nr:alpha/beta hydrolase [Diaminobutyricimonas aerilata]PJJ71133.1 alpha/beta hydrolase family protein [Diaminobutyricimonas aerilata]